MNPDNMLHGAYDFLKGFFYKIFSSSDEFVKTIDKVLPVISQLSETINKIDHTNQIAVVAAAQKFLGEIGVEAKLAESWASQYSGSLIPHILHDAAVYGVTFLSIVPTNLRVMLDAIIDLAYAKYSESHPATTGTQIVKTPVAMN